MVSRPVRRERRYTLDQLQSLGEEIFDRKVKALVADADAWDFVGIDVESENFETGADEILVSRQLRARNPEAQIWMRRVGFPVAHYFGGTPRSLIQQPGKTA